MKPITQSKVKEIFDYKDGMLIWKKVHPRSHRAKVGDIAGYIRSNGYNYTGVAGSIYSTHRLIFLWHHGYTPTEIDHIDNDKLNNRIENLRECSRENNMRNQPLIRKNNSSGYKGVGVVNGRYKARIGANNKLHYMGTFNTAIEAAKAYDKKALEVHGEYANLNFPVS